MFPMKGEYFAAHRARIIEMFRKFKLERSIIFLRSDNLFKECFVDIELPFYQEALFYWLSGWKMANSAIIIDVHTKKSILLVPDFDEESTYWVYPRLSFKDIKNQTHVDEVAYMKDLDIILDKINKTSRPIHRFLGYSEDPPLEYDDTKMLIDIGGLARKVKFEWEIKCLKYAAELTSEALVYAMKHAKPGMNEKNLDIDFRYYGELHGADKTSFLTTIASGEHASFPHYNKNDSDMKSGKLVVMDCGFYFNHYAGDVSRTFPVNGKFNDLQKEMYNSMFMLQMYVISLIKPGVHISDLDSLALEWIFDILKKHNIVNQNLPYNDDIAFVFAPHSISHHVGCNVHDLCMFSEMNQDDTLQKDMVITIEPGIYFNKGSLEKAKNDNLPINYDKALEYCDIIGGIRIEDDLLITDNGIQFLSNAPKTIDEIESIMRQK